MKVVQNNIDALNATLSVSIVKDDYEPKFKAEINKLKSTVQLKGFRKGKTPVSTIKKMYGPQVLAEAVNEALQKALSDYIVDNDLNLLGQPLPADDNDDDLVFEPSNLIDYTFDFEIGMAPTFEVQGASEADSYKVYKVEVGDDEAMEELTQAAKRQGDRIEVEDGIVDNDIIQVKAFELDDNDQKLDGGWETGFSVMVELLNDEPRAAVKALKMGEDFNFDIYNLEQNRTEAYVKKYLLNLGEEEEKEIGSNFVGVIEKITRLVPASMDQDFFDGYFGEGGVTSLEEAKEKIKESISAYYDEQARNLMYREIMDGLLSSNKFDLPKDFLKKWLAFNNESVPSDDELDKAFDNLRWTLISSSLAKQYDVKVESEDIQRHFAQQAMQYMGQYGGDPSLVQGIVTQMMQNQEQVNKAFEEIRAQRVFEDVAKVITQIEEPISAESFRDMVKAMNEKVNA